jgi:hypothetical protein
MLFHRVATHCISTPITYSRRIDRFTSVADVVESFEKKKIEEKGWKPCAAPYEAVAQPTEPKGEP